MKIEADTVLFKGGQVLGALCSTELSKHSSEFSDSLNAIAVNASGDPEILLVRLFEACFDYIQFQEQNK